MTEASCARCGKAARLAPCFQTDNGDQFHYVCIMINVNLEKPLALEPAVSNQSLGEFQRSMMDTINKYRKQHSSCELKWSRKCEGHARKWVDYLLSLNTGPNVESLSLQHDSYKGMGENLYLQECRNKVEPRDAAHRVVKNWYSEEADYDFTSNDYDQDASHFTQLIWKGTWKMGAAYGQVGNVFVAVCNFWPSGNIQGWFLDNVSAKRGHKI